MYAYTKGTGNQGNNVWKVNCWCVFFAYILKPYSSLWAVFVNKNRCISVTLVSEEDNLIFQIFDNSYKSFLWPEYFTERWITCQASTSVLCLLYRPETVHCGTKNVCKYLTATHLDYYRYYFYQSNSITKIVNKCSTSSW